MDKLLVSFRRREERNWCQTFSQREHEELRKAGGRRWLPPLRDHPESQGPSCVSQAPAPNPATDRRKRQTAQEGRKAREEEEA